MPTTHVTSLELSRRLKELVVPQESLFYWVKYPDSWGIAPESLVAGRPTEYGETSAYLASELGEMLKSFFDDSEGEPFNPPKEAGLEPKRFSEIWNPDYLAKLLIYLLENHLISVEELGK